MNTFPSLPGRGLRLVLFAMLALGSPIVAVSGEPVKSEDIRVREYFSGLRIPFVANTGQTDAAVAFYAPTFAGTLFVTRDGRIVYSLPGGKDLEPEAVRSRAGWTLVETVVDGKAHPIGGSPAATGVSYMIGNDPIAWRSGVPTFATVALGEVWPGISLGLAARAKNVEKIFTVAPGGDPSRIRMSVAGARRLRLDHAEGLVMETGVGEVRFTPPIAFQERRGVRHPIVVAYELYGQDYGFRLGDYDPELPVVIDPLIQATYVGGSGGDEANAIAIHPMTGEVYVAGFTGAQIFPGTAGGAQPNNSGGTDAFVARLNAALTTLIQATFLGGSLIDSATGLAIHPSSGDIYVTGNTTSTNFPATAGGAVPDNLGGGAFVARLNAALTTLHQSSYMGGSGGGSASGIAVHPASGDVYVTGATSSTTFPGTTGGAQPTKGLGTSQDAFVARLNGTLTTLLQATYLGGSATDFANAITIHPTSGEVYVAGLASSFFPGTTGGAQVNSGGATDGFVARFNAALTALNQATYLGGSGADVANAVVIHPISGDVYIAGNAGAVFPFTGGGAQISSGGDTDGFVTRMNAALTTIHQSTFLGGSNVDQGRGLAIHPVTGDVYAVGITQSINFPDTTGGAQADSGGGSNDAFVARFNAALTTRRQSTYLGGTGGEHGRGVAVHPVSGDVYVTGMTSSTNFPRTAGGAQPNAASGDAFLARLSFDLASSNFTINCPVDSLQTAINLAAPGSTMVVSGTCSENILIRNEKQRITIDGGGTATISAPSNGSPAVNIRGKGVLLQNFTITGGNNGVWINRGSNAVLNTNLIQNSAGNGVLVDEMAFAVLTNNTVRNHPGAGVIVQEASTARIGFNSDADTSASINFIYNNGLGILVSNGSSARIVGNTIDSNTGDAIEVVRASHAEISSNQIFTNGGDGIEVGENSSVQLGEDSGTSIFESPNESTNANQGFGIRCTNGAIAEGRLGSLNGILAAKDFASPSCIDSLN